MTLKQKIKNLVMNNQKATDNELLCLFYESEGFDIPNGLREVMTSSNRGITTVERKFRDFNHLRDKRKESPKTFQEKLFD